MIDQFKSLFKSQLTRGVKPRELALTCSFAFIMGTFPLLGTTTALCLVAAYCFNLNQPLLQALNYLLTPVHLLMIPIYLKIGEWILRAPAVSINPAEMMRQFSGDWKGFFVDYSSAIGHAVLAWVIVAPLVGIFIFYMVRPLVILLNRKWMRETPK